MKKGIIISGGTLDEAFADSYIKNVAAACQSDDDRYTIIAADSGLKYFAKKLKDSETGSLLPDYIVGDFDSYRDAAAEDFEKMGCVVKRYRPEKDMTDTQIAAELAMELGCRQVHVLGGTGTRLDHVLGNLQVMELALSKGVSMIIADEHNHLTMHSSSLIIRREKKTGVLSLSTCDNTSGSDILVFGYNPKDTFISLIPWGGDVSHLTIEGLKYPLNDHTMKTGLSLGISNELALDEGKITFSKGKLIVVISRDGGSF